MQIMSGLRYLNRPLTYGSSSSSSSSAAAASTLNHDDHEDNDHHHNNNNNNRHKLSKRKLSIIHFDLKPGNKRTTLYVIYDDIDDNDIDADIADIDDSH